LRRRSHGGGEEILVLEGVFSDEQGDYPAGTFMSNPVGSSQVPFIETGCTILVKRHQMHLFGHSPVGGGHNTPLPFHAGGVSVVSTGGGVPGMT
jgi:hypothetical protein